MRQAFCGCASSGIQRPRVASRRLVPLALLSSAHLARTPHTYLVSLAYLHTIHTRTARILTRPPAVASARNHVSKATHTHTHTQTHTHTHTHARTHTRSREKETRPPISQTRGRAMKEQGAHTLTTQPPPSLARTQRLTQVLPQHRAPPARRLPLATRIPCMDGGSSYSAAAAALRPCGPAALRLSRRWPASPARTPPPSPRRRGAAP